MDWPHPPNIALDVLALKIALLSRHDKETTHFGGIDGYDICSLLRRTGFICEQYSLWLHVGMETDTRWNCLSYDMTVREYLEHEYTHT